jgi:hypothetical protein
MIEIPIRLTNGDAQALELEVARCGTKPAMLARCILATTLRGQILDAVLDDDHAPESASIDEEAKTIRELAASLGGDIDEAMCIFAQQSPQKR